MKPAVLSKQARRDLLEGARWIAADNPTAARAFRDSVAAAARRLGEHPGLGVERPQLVDPPIRFLVLSGFPYVVVYDAARTPPLVLRVLHTARDIHELLRGI